MENILIVGGGVTGIALACALAQKGLEVILIDQNDPHIPPVSDGKSFALSPSSAALFAQIGVWGELTEITPITTIHTSDGMCPQSLEYTEKDIQTRALGYVIDSAHLKLVLQKRLLSYKNIQIYAPTQVTSLERTPTQVIVKTQEGLALKAPLCIASDGKFSMIRDWAEIPLLKWEYNQTAIVCNMAHTLPHENRAFEHFLPSGPLAFVPRPGNESGLIWSIENEKAACLLSLSSEAFAEEAEAHFGSSLGNFTLTSERWSYPLSVCLPKRFTEHRLALLGDAAHSFHPIAGQGLNVGLRDVATLAEIMGEAFSLGLDLGSSYVLDTYQRRRRVDILSMTFVTDCLVRAFSNQSQVMAHIRTLGFGAVKHIRPLKNFMIRHAAGV
jgi:2-octaprenyl-6-methoxyphenol hydroxylase